MKKKELKQHIKKRMNYLLDNDAGEFEWCDEYAEVEYITLYNVLYLIDNGVDDGFSWDISVGALVVSENLFKPEDLIIKSWASKNKGKWSTVEGDGIFIYHKPTQTEYKCDSERSQHKNRQICFDQLNDYLRKGSVSHKKLTKLKQRSKRKSISKAKFWRVYRNNSYQNVEFEEFNTYLFGVNVDLNDITSWAETETHIYYFDPRRKLYFRDVL